MATLSNALEEKVIKDPEIAEETREFVDWIAHGDFKTRDPRSLTSPQEVQGANSLLDRILGRNKPKI